MHLRSGRSWGSADYLRSLEAWPSLARPDRAAVSLLADRTRQTSSGYRLRRNTAQPLSLVSRTVWLPPRTTTWIVPETPYSLL